MIPLRALTFLFLLVGDAHGFASVLTRPTKPTYSVIQQMGTPQKSTIPIFSMTLSSTTTRRSRLFSNNNHNNDSFDTMRQLLEASWNADTMGDVPSDAVVAAKEAWDCIQSAQSRQGTLVHFVDLLLPAYDVSFGSNLYDMVVAVEYCIALAECFPGRTEILVRDDPTLTSVTRILQARKDDNNQRPERDMLVLEDEEEDEEEEEEEEEEEGEKMDDDEEIEAKAPAIEDDDKDDKTDDTMERKEVDDFRKQLMADWDAPVATNTLDDAAENKPAVPETPAGRKSKVNPKPNPTVDKRYRLASLFGTARISKDGPDVMEQVVKALQANALPNDDEDTIIILSAITREEMIAVRSLVAKYGGGAATSAGSNTTKQRTIVLVNCKLHPIPRELMGAETVYSILPMIARSTDASSRDEVPPKVLLLRRFPGDWQVFVDLNHHPKTKGGAGFQLAQTAPSNRSNQRGPPMDWVQKVVQQYLEAHS